VARTSSPYRPRGSSRENTVDYFFSRLVFGALFLTAGFLIVFFPARRTASNNNSLRSLALSSPTEKGGAVNVRGNDQGPGPISPFGAFDMKGRLSSSRQQTSGFPISPVHQIFRE
jgi:hypothetical protein